MARMMTAVAVFITAWFTAPASAQSPRTKARLSYRTAARDAGEANERTATAKINMAVAFRNQGRQEASDGYLWDIAVNFAGTRSASEACYVLGTSPISSASRVVPSHGEAPPLGSPAVTYSARGRGIIAAREAAEIARIEKLKASDANSAPGVVIVDVGTYGMLREVLLPGERGQERQWVRISVPSDDPNGVDVWMRISNLIFPASIPASPPPEHSESYRATLAHSAARRKARDAAKQERRAAALIAAYQLAKQNQGMGGFGGASDGGFSGGSFGGFSGGSSGGTHLCGAPTATTDGPCRNPVAGPGFCWRHR